MKFSKKQLLKQYLTYNVLTHLFSFAVLILSVVCYYSNFTDYNFDNTFNSDSVGVPYLFKDIFHDGGKFKDWQLASAPTLFPDLILYYLLYLIFELDFLTVTFWFAIIQVVSIAVLSCFVYRKLVPNAVKKFSWLVPLFYCIIFFEGYYYTGDQILPFLFSTYSFHTGTFLNTLIALSLLVANIKVIWKVIFLFIISGVAMYSDMMFAVAFIAPLIAVSVFQSSFFGWKKSMLWLFTVLIGGALGYYLFNYINTTGSLNYASSNRFFNFDNIAPSYDIMSNHIKWYLDRPGYMTVIVQFLLISIPLVFTSLVLFYKKLPGNFRYFLIFYLIFITATMSAPVLMGNYMFVDCIRYNSSMYFFTTVGMSVLIGLFLSLAKKHHIIQTGLSYVIIFLFFLAPVLRFKTDRLNNYFTYYPPKVRVLDSICEKQNLSKGISDYWKAKWTCMFSRKGVKLVTVYPSINFYEVGSNINWFFDGDYDFIVPENLDSAQIRKIFVILDTIKTREITVLKVKKYRYIPNVLFPVQVDSIKSNYDK